MEKYILFLCLPLLLAGSLHGAEKPDTLKQGAEISYYKDGSIKRESFFVNGKRQGPETTYSQCGSRRLETPYVEGKIHGMQIMYRGDGSKEKETP